jgi:predicted RNase H-like HicB family nuclease
MLKIEIEREDDGRWIAEVPELPGALAYGSSEAEARIKVTALALHIIADEELGPQMLARLARATNLEPGDL